MMQLLEDSDMQPTASQSPQRFGLSRPQKLGLLLQSTPAIGKAGGKLKCAQVYALAFQQGFS